MVYYDRLIFSSKVTQAPNPIFPNAPEPFVNAGGGGGSESNTITPTFTKTSQLVTYSDPQSRTEPSTDHKLITEMSVGICLPSCKVTKQVGTKEEIQVEVWHYPAVTIGITFTK